MLITNKDKQLKGDSIKSSQVPKTQLAATEKAKKEAPPSASEDRMNELVAEIVRVLDFRSMQFAAAHKKVNEAVEIWESRLLHSGDELFGTGHRCQCSVSFSDPR